MEIYSSGVVYNVVSHHKVQSLSFVNLKKLLTFFKQFTQKITEQCVCVCVCVCVRARARVCVRVFY